MKRELIQPVDKRWKRQRHSGCVHLLTFHCKQIFEYLPSSRMSSSLHTSVRRSIQSTIYHYHIPAVHPPIRRPFRQSCCRSLYHFHPPPFFITHQHGCHFANVKFYIKIKVLYVLVVLLVNITRRSLHILPLSPHG